MLKKTYILGHKNPDTDSICSSIAYAYLKNKLDKLEYEAVCLGDLNQETQFVLDMFNLPAPRKIDHVKIRIKDIMTPGVISVKPDTLVRDIGILMYEHNIRSVPVVDEHNIALGVVTEREIAYNYIKNLNLEDFKTVASQEASVIMENNIFIVDEEEILSETIEDILKSPHKEALVVDKSNRLVGIVTRTNLVNPEKRRVIILDHSEISQSADGIKEASIIEIIDHHHLGDLQTPEPILVISKPVGSTSTIITERFNELRVDIPRDIAGILLGAVLSDTVLLKSPTATQKDKEIVERLSKIAGIDWFEFGARMYDECSDVSSLSATDLLNSDFKVYNFSDVKIGIGQIETTNSKGILRRKNEIFDEMNKELKDKDFELIVLMITDIIREGTELLAVGKTKLAEKAFNCELVDNSVFLPGVISRKKQIAAPLFKVIG
ncbi:MAG: putative manganese-dependent inorganic diphosphatase [Actinobacteria bacterium]|nr:putative manganese-dependent inorganic diphosphatase [Actinomycetota bacterium]